MLAWLGRKRKASRAICRATRLKATQSATQSATQPATWLQLQLSASSSFNQFSVVSEQLQQLPASYIEVEVRSKVGSLAVGWTWQNRAPFR
eukprot:2192900-Alexandrium_andersonii.AAC.1